MRTKTAKVEVMKNDITLFKRLFPVLTGLTDCFGREYEAEPYFTQYPLKSMKKRPYSSKTNEIIIRGFATIRYKENAPMPQTKTYQVCYCVINKGGKK
jgi:hypothetical protein